MARAGRLSSAAGGCNGSRDREHYGEGEEQGRSQVHCEIASMRVEMWWWWSPLRVGALGKGGNGGSRATSPQLERRMVNGRLKAPPWP